MTKCCGMQYRHNTEQSYICLKNKSLVFDLFGVCILSFLITKYNEKNTLVHFHTNVQVQYVI